MVFFGLNGNVLIMMILVKAGRVHMTGIVYRCNLHSDASSREVGHPPFYRQGN